MADVRTQATFLQDKKVAFFFSGGKDAIAAAHLCLPHMSPKPEFIYFYFVEGLEIVERTLKYYEKLFGIQVHRRPCHETLSIVSRETGGRKYSYSDTEAYVRDELDIDWVITGMKRADSLARRGMFKKLGVDCMDHDKQRWHPLLDWSEKKVLAYCKMKKLPLPLTYSHGIKNSFWIPDVEFLMWLRPRFPGDYKKIVSFFPSLGDGVYRRERGI